MRDCTAKGWMQKCACVAAARQSPMTGVALCVGGKVEICVPAKRGGTRKISVCVCLHAQGVFLLPLSACITLKKGASKEPFNKIQAE